MTRKQKAIALLKLKEIPDTLTLPHAHYSDLKGYLKTMYKTARNGKGHPKEAAIANMADVYDAIITLGENLEEEE